MSRRFSQSIRFPLVTIVAMVVVLLVSKPTIAGPVTGTFGSAPFSRLSLYEGVLGVIPGGVGDEVLEVGYRGEEIATSGDMYLRPGSVTQADGARLCTDCYAPTATFANLFIPGQVCLYANNGLTPDCRASWPAGGAGASYWEMATGFAPGNPFTSVQYLQPNASNATRAIHIGTAGDPVGGVALNINSGAEGGEAFVQNTSADPAAKALHIVGNLRAFTAHVKGKIQVNGQEVFSENNKGQYSGLDADTLEGNNVTLETAASCRISDLDARIGCLCFNVGGQKRCLQILNRSI